MIAKLPVTLTTANIPVEERRTRLARVARILIKPNEEDAADGQIITAPKPTPSDEADI